MPPSLSIIIPSYNRPTQLGRAIASACAAAPEDAEILVIDDGSWPAFAEAPTDRRVRLIRHSQNLGAAAARNTGLGAARGEWVAFLDSDDTWPEQSFAARWAWARSRIDASPLTIFVAGFRTIDIRNGRTRVRHPISSRDPLWFAGGCWFCPGSTALFRRDPILNAIGPQDPSLRRLEDLDWFLRLALAGGGVESSPLVGAEINRAGAPALQLVAQCRKMLLRKYAASPFALPRALYRRLAAYLDIECAAAFWFGGRPAGTVAYLARSWLAAPRARLHLERFWT